MLNPIQKREVPIVDLANECFPQFVSRHQREELLENGCLINVTAWVHREMDFGPNETRLRVHVAVTARLWKALHTIPQAIRFFQTVRGRGHDLLWLAA